MLTTALSAKGPEVTSSGRDMAFAQCLVADSQSWASIDDCRAERHDYIIIKAIVPHGMYYVSSHTLSSIT